MATRPPPPTVPRPQSPPAQREMLIAFFDFLEDKLENNGFFRPVTKKPGMRRNLRNIFHRMEPTQQDVRTLWGAVVRPGRGAADRGQDAQASSAEKDRARSELEPAVEAGVSRT